MLSYVNLGLLALITLVPLTVQVKESSNASRLEANVSASPHRPEVTRWDEPERKPITYKLEESAPAQDAAPAEDAAGNRAATPVVRTASALYAGRPPKNYHLNQVLLSDANGKFTSGSYPKMQLEYAANDIVTLQRNSNQGDELPKNYQKLTYIFDEQANLGLKNTYPKRVYLSVPLNKNLKYPKVIRIMTS